ncbi:hypothetical protein NC651_018337 [Populus alba x Populus x berolinensis]|nr:hypothetical protein NC651_018337 [Populus alba x Populus x berolinensis]
MMLEILNHFPIIKSKRVMVQILLQVILVPEQIKE